MQPTHALLDAALGDMIATGKALDPVAVFLGVATAITPNGVDTLLADLTEATGLMSTRQALVSYSGPYHLDSGAPVYDAPTIRFAPASAAEAQTLVAWFLATALTGGNLLAFGMIDPPATLADQTDEWGIVVRITLDPSGIWSAEATFDG